jgi:hypothetical protein
MGAGTKEAAFIDTPFLGPEREPKEQGELFFFGRRN